MKDKLYQLSEYIRTGKCPVAHIPFDSIITFIENVYQHAGHSTDQYVLLYGNILSQGIVHNDINLIADVLELLAKHAEIIEEKVLINKNLLMSSYVSHTISLHNANCYKNLKWDMEHESEIALNPPFEGKGVVYSAITGNYDDVKEIGYMNPNLDYVLFTNNPNIKSDTWKVVYVSNEEQLDNVRMARKIKIMGHLYLSGYDYSIWVDGKLEIRDNLERYVLENRRTKPILCFNHYFNDCIYNEKETCLFNKKDDPTIMEEQIERYRKEGYPEHNGMIDSCLLVRELNDPKIKQLMETWWSEVLHGSRRDQLSFNYACWKNEMLYDTSPLVSIENRYVKLHKHN